MVSFLGVVAPNRSTPLGKTLEHSRALARSKALGVKLHPDPGSIAMHGHRHIGVIVNRWRKKPMTVLRRLIIPPDSEGVVEYHAPRCLQVVKRGPKLPPVSGDGFDASMDDGSPGPRKGYDVHAIPMQQCLKPKAHTEHRYSGARVLQKSF